MNGPPFSQESTLLAIWYMATAVVAGCNGPSQVVALEDASQFETEVLQASHSQPVLMDFFKEGCAACIALEPTIDKLSNEYAGRVTVMRYPLMSFIFIPHSAELRRQHDVVLYPTVVLFVDGVEYKRWVADYSIEHYRQALDPLVAPPSPAE